MIYNAYFRSVTPDGHKAVVDIYNYNDDSVEAMVHISFNRIFILSRDSIMLNISYNNIHNRLVRVDIPDINRINNIRIISIFDVV